MFSKIGNQPDAKTATTEAFVAALDPLHRSTSATKVRAYLLATARTRLTDHRRRTPGNDITTLTDNDTADPVRGDTQTSSQALRQTPAILAQLPKPYQRSWRYGCCGCCSTPQAAAPGASGGIRRPPTVASDPMNTPGTRRFIANLLRERRPRSFRADDADIAQLRAAIALRAATPGSAIPQDQFVTDLHQRLAAQPAKPGSYPRRT